MPLNVQQLAAQKNLSYVLTEKLAQRILRGEYVPGTVLPDEVELGDQSGASRTTVKETVKILTVKGMVLPRPRIGTRVMPQANRNLLDQELLTWWITGDNFPQIIKYSLVMRISLRPQAYLLVATIDTAEWKVHLNTLMEKVAELRRNFRRKHWIEVDIAWHRHICEMSASPLLISPASLFHPVYQTYFTSITCNDVVRLDLRRVIVDVIGNNGGDRAFAACQALLIASNVLPDK